MKEYMVLVQAEDYISVEAETPEEAIDLAIGIAEGDNPDWRGTIIKRLTDTCPKSKM